MAQINLFPFGNAKRENGKIECQHGVKECDGNKIIACSGKIIQNEIDRVQFVVNFEKHILDNKKNIHKALENCKEDGVTPKLIVEQIEECHNSSEGQSLVEVAAQATESLNPPHEYVPWIVINGKHNPNEEKQAIENLIKHTCKIYKDAAYFDICHQYLDNQDEYMFVIKNRKK